MVMQAQLADGRVLEFPDGTDPNVIQATVKRMLGQQTQTTPQRRPTGGQSGRGRRNDTAIEREQFLSSLPPERRSLIESITPLEAAAIGAGRGLTAIGRGLGLADPEDPLVTESFEQLRQVRPETTIGEVAGQSAPFLLPGVGVGAVPGLAARAVATGALGAAEGGIIARGEGRDLGQQFFSAGIGGTAASAFELGVPVIGRLGGKIIRRVTGSAPKGAVIDAQGNPSQEFLDALEESGQSFDDVIAETQRELSREAVNPEQAARKSFLESQGLTGDAAPTRAQITRSVDDFKIQQEALKSSGRVEARLAAQDQVLSSRFDNAILQTSGDPVTPTSSVTDALVNKASTLDSEISRLYKTARDRAPGEKNVRFSTLSNKLRELAPSNRRAGGNIEAVVGDLRAKGVLDDNFNVVGKIDVETAENVRQLMNELFDPQNAFGNIKLRELKQALDDDVFKAAGKDVFNQGRAAKRLFERDLTRAKLSKFDNRKRNIVRDILENKDSVNPEQFVDKVVFGKSVRSTDLEQLKDYITDTDAGSAAWNDLRAETLQGIKERAFIGPEDAQGFQSLSRDKLSKAMKAVGDDKLDILFSKPERKFLDDLLRVSQLREPRRATQQGLGPSAQSVLRIEKKLTNLPILGSVFGFLDLDAAGRLATRSKAARTITQSTAPSQLRTAGALLAAPGLVAAQEEQ